MHGGNGKIRNEKGRGGAEIITWSAILRSRILFFSKILTAKPCPDSISLAYLTFPKLPSPRVLPNSYFPSCIPFFFLFSSFLHMYCLFPPPKHPHHPTPSFSPYPSQKPVAAVTTSNTENQQKPSLFVIFLLKPLSLFLVGFLLYIRPLIIAHKEESVKANVATLTYPLSIHFPNIYLFHHLNITPPPSRPSLYNLSISLPLITCTFPSHFPLFNLAICIIFGRSWGRL